MWYLWGHETVGCWQYIVYIHHDTQHKNRGIPQTIHFLPSWYPFHSHKANKWKKKLFTKKNFNRFSLNLYFIYSRIDLKPFLLVFIWMMMKNVNIIFPYFSFSLFRLFVLSSSYYSIQRIYSNEFPSILLCQSQSNYFKRPTQMLDLCLVRFGRVCFVSSNRNAFHLLSAEVSHATGKKRVKCPLDSFRDAISILKFLLCHFNFCLL